MIQSLKIFLTSFPPRIIAWKLYCRIFRKKIPGLKNWQQYFINKSGVEIGGPSALFNDQGFLPLYTCIQSLDGVNFSTSTVWEGSIAEGNFFKYQHKTGYQFIAEGTHLPTIKNEQYDFVISCNNLEHIANPLLALNEWKRIIKTGGNLLLILPNKKANFDHKRPDTTTHHIIQDYESKMDERDLTHLEEILELHDLTRDPQARPFSKFNERCKNNFDNRCMHHHVFSATVLKDLMEYSKMEVLMQYSSPTDHYLLARKL